jgi:DNA-binding MarR family transcriptional regulator
MRHIAMKTNDFSKSFMYSIHQMHFLVQKHLEQVLAKRKSLSFSQFMILVGFTCSENDSVSQTCIAERLSLTEATVSRHISSLVEMGLLSRAEVKTNRRKHVITITEKGKKTFQAASSIIDKELETIFSSIKEKDRAGIMRNFSQVLTELLTKK